jgi:hypothetical protein
MRARISCIGLTAAAVVLGLAAAPEAADHQNLEELLPTAVEDAYPIAYRGRELQGRFEYDRTRDDENRYTLSPRLELGLFPNFQAEIQAPYRLGSVKDADRGDVLFGGLYNLNQETIMMPAVAVAGEGKAPFGSGDEPWESRATFLATKTLPSATLQRVHVNASWVHAYDAKPEERDDRYAVAVGYSRALQAELLLVLDVLREQELGEGETNDLVEAGLRYQMTPLLVLAAGGGVGYGDSETDFRVLAGFQYALAKLPLEPLP